MMQLIDEREIRKAIEQLHDDDRLFEIRVIGNRSKKPISGYFKDADTLLAKFKTVDLNGANVYITLNQIDESLFSRIQSECFVAGAAATQDKEVNGYRWFFIDLDPERASGISSTDDELKEAYATAKKVALFLKDCGFEEPVKAMSGNGAHLLYRINLANTDANRALIERCLKALSMMFDTERVKIDTVNCNQSRVCKLYGTLAQKGKSTKSRPYRMSHIFGDARECKVTDRVYLEKLAAELPEEDIKPDRTNNYNSNSFDIERWMDEHGLRYTAKTWNGGTKFILDECPFDSSHKAPDSMIVKSASGAIGFKCLHNSCSGHHWRELRMMLEPDAYNVNDDERRITEGYLKHNRDKDHQEEIQQRQDVKEKDSEPMFLNAVQILEMSKTIHEEYVKTGINFIDNRMKGLEKGCISVMSGLRGAAKSTILSQIILNGVQNKMTSVCYSGELSPDRFMKWMFLQAAGKGYTQEYNNYIGSYYCPESIKPFISAWMKDYMLLYNNHYGNNFSKISKCLREIILKAKADICIIDNLMALDLSSYNDRDKYEAQTAFVWELKDIAANCNVHVILVAHPRKAQGFLRLDDISGTGNISNIVDNAFIIHRNNEDFRKRTKEMYGWKADNQVYTGTNVIEICKDRDGGIQDEFIPLFYEPESKRLRNNKQENIVYGWRDEYERQRDFESVDNSEIPFE